MPVQGRAVTRIWVFQQDGSGDLKVAGIEEYGRGVGVSRVVDIKGPFPEFIDDPGEYLDEYLLPGVGADLVLDFLMHPDLSQYLVERCLCAEVPVVASGQHVPGAITPFTCCGLGRGHGLGAYEECFGVPEYQVRIDQGRIIQVEVLRGASCGATWRTAQALEGMEPHEAVTEVGRLVQYQCVADPSKFDPVSGKSALHFSGHVHSLALAKAIKRA